MNILFVLSRFPVYGGMERMTITLASALCREGYDVHLLSRPGDAAELKDLLHPAVRCAEFSDSELNSSSNVGYLTNYIRIKKIDRVINQGIYPEVTSLLARVYGLENDLPPLISVLHNDPLAPCKDISRILAEKSIKSLVKRIFRNWYVKRIERLNSQNLALAALYSQRIVLLSDSFVPDFVRIVPGCADKIVVIPNGFEIPPLNNAEIIERKEKKVVYIGRVVEAQKRISRLIYIWKDLTGKFDDWSLQIIGGGDDLNKIKELAARLEIKNIEFTGYQKDVSVYLEKASIICLVSDMEGFPLVLNEGMQYGVIPVSYGTYSALWDIVDDGDTGFIIPPFNHHLYVHVLKELMRNIHLRKRMGIQAQKASHRYDIGFIIRYWTDLLAGLPEK